MTLVRKKKSCVRRISPELDEHIRRLENETGLSYIDCSKLVFATSKKPKVDWGFG